MKNALLEIGTEEIPSSYLEPAAQQLQTLAGEFLSLRNLNSKGLKTFVTPRRIALLVEELDEKSKDIEEEIQDHP